MSGVLRPSFRLQKHLGATSPLALWILLRGFLRRSGLNNHPGRKKNKTTRNKVDDSYLSRAFLGFAAALAAAPPILRAVLMGCGGAALASIRGPVSARLQGAGGFVLRFRRPLPVRVLDLCFWPVQGEGPPFLAGSAWEWKAGRTAGRHGVRLVPFPADHQSAWGV